VLLPNTTFLEGYDLVKSYGPWTLGLSRPVIEPVGESRSNAEVFGDLLELTGLREDSDPRGELEEMLHVARLPARNRGQRGAGTTGLRSHRSMVVRCSSSTCFREPRIGR
jgi:anaerobic selenocysteine-containing dehydrogenase